MHTNMLGLLRCPFCGTRVSLVDDGVLVREGDHIDSGVFGCECCAFPIVAGIPVMIADDTTRLAMHQMEAGQPDDALCILLGLGGAGTDTLDGGLDARLMAERREAFRALLGRGDRVTYREAVGVLSADAEGTYFVYRFSDPTYVLAQSLLQAIGQNRWPAEHAVLDVCGGSGHLTRVLAGLRSPANAPGTPGSPAMSRGNSASSTVLADVYFWKLWLAARFTSPDCEAVCCDANNPLPFARDTFSMVVLSDAFPYIWHKRLLADEMMRLAGPDGLVLLPHLHSALGENFSAGMTLTPAAYRDLFGRQGPRLFSDSTLLTQVLERGTIDLAHDVDAADLGAEPSLTIVASHRADLFREYELPAAPRLAGELQVNPLYRVERRANASVLTLTFPTPEYEEEFGECKRYLPAVVTVGADLAGPIEAEALRSALGAEYDDLRRRRVLIDMPSRYWNR